MAEGEVGFQNFDSGLLGRRQDADGKSVENRLHQPPDQGSNKCPQCSSKKLYKDGVRKTNSGDVQRYLCRECGYRFSDPNFKRLSHESVKQSLNTEGGLVSGYRLCAISKVKKLDAAEIKTVAGDIQPSLELQTRKGIIINFMLYMKKQGFRPSTISTRADLITCLCNQGVDLNNPEDVKFAIADKKCSEGYKKNLVLAYDTLLRMQGKNWDKPNYKPDPKLPFVPLESEIDQIINSAGRRTGTFLATLKETGADPGEALAIEWIDVDCEQKTLTINHPVKGHKSRILSVSSSLINRLEVMPKTADRVFCVKMRTLLKNYGLQRGTAARKFNNPRLKKIKFTTFRHWKATMEYHKTKDILWVMRLLGHNSLKTTLIYIDLEIALFHEANDGFTAKIATSLEEACKLVEVGFEYVCEMDGKKLFKKRK